MLRALAGARDRIAIAAMHRFPRAAFCRAAGWAASRQIPPPARPLVVGAFARWVGADLAEMDSPPAAYPTVDAFFTRRLRTGTRIVDPDPRRAVSPVDGRVVSLGRVAAGRLIQAKGTDYSLAGLLGDEREARRFDGGAFLTLYLSPSDYHRVHAPVEGQVVGYGHIPGDFYPVSPLAVRAVPGLFSVNERLVVYMESDAGAIAVVLVAAMGVGHISLAVDPGVRTRTGGGAAHVRYRTPFAVAKGGELGAFHLGSTVVVLWQAGRAELRPLATGERVLLGQAVADLVSAA